ncbi:MAG: flippase [Actinobacteria bacterium]|nr:flippase [Actinomycetota bacterium]
MSGGLPSGALVAAGAALAAAALVYLLRLALRPLSPPAVQDTQAVARRFRRNALAPIAASVADRVLFWAFWIVALRILGPAGNGEYAFALNLLTYVGTLVDFGLGTLVTREVARDPNALASVFGQALALRGRLLLAGIPVMLGVAFAYWAGGAISGTTVAVAAILAAGLVPSAVNQAYAAVYGAWERMDRRAYVVVGTSGLTVGLGLLLLGLGLGVLGVALAGLASSLGTVVALARPVGFGLLASGRAARAADLRRLAAASLPLMLNSLLATAFIQVDVLILQPLQGTEVVGNYNAAYKFINALNVLPASIVLAAFPIMARASADPVALAEWFARAWRVLITLGAGATALGFIFAADIVGGLLGQAFLPDAATALAILIWFVPLSYLNGTLQYVLISLDRQWWLTPAFAATTAFNVGLNLALIPAFSFRAAAVVTVASEAVLLGIFLWLLRREPAVRRIVEPAVRPVLAVVPTVAAAWAVRDLPWLAGGALALAVYVAGLLATGGLRIGSLHALGSAVTGRARTE